MKNLYKKSVAFLTVVLFAITAIIPTSIGMGNLLLSDGDTEQELDLLYGETNFNLTALEDISYPFNLSYVVPLNYNNQAPILFEVCEDASTDLVTFRIINETNAPNKIINFTIAPLTKGTVVTIHFQYWVLVRNNDYTDLPRYVKIPKEKDLPDNIKTWLVSTKNIQSDNIIIKLKAKQIKGFTNNLVRLANKIALSTSDYVKLYRPLSRLINIIPNARDFTYDIVNKNREHDWLPLQDAFSELFLGGCCYGRAHLGAAIFRANGVPARSIIITPTYGKKISFEQHVICEYYCPDYEWVPVETTFACAPPKGIVEDIVEKIAHKLGVDTRFPVPYETKGYIVLRINYPDDENEAGNGLSYYGGMEAYMKMYPREVAGYLNNSQTHGWIEKELATNQQNADNALSLTKDVYELHTKYIGMNLNGENKQHYDNAILAQKNAINCFNQSDINGYINNITIAYTEYGQIIL